MTEGISLSQLSRPSINMNNSEVGNNPNDKASGEEYFDRRGQQQEQEDFQQYQFIDRSAQLRATMNSLAALNAASIIKSTNKYKKNVDKKLQEADNTKKILKVQSENTDKNNEEEENNEP